MSTGFNVKSGLLEPKHRDNIGIAVWEFLWCIDRTTQEREDENGDIWGIVLGGKPIQAEEISDSLGTHPETVKKNLRRLDNFGYLMLKRTPYGNIIHVGKSLKWRPKTVQKAEKQPDKPNQFANIFGQEFGRPMSPTEYQKLNSYIDDGLQDEMVSEAIKRARVSGVVNVKYVEGILNNWLTAGIKTMTQVEVADQEHEKSKTKSGPKNKGPDKTKKDKFKLLYG